MSTAIRRASTKMRGGSVKEDGPVKEMTDKDIER
jgi:hypothetical protein